MMLLRRKFLFAIVVAGCVLVIAATMMVRRWRRAPSEDDPLRLLVVPFRHQVVDPNPLTGAECCTDVLALGDINGDGRPDIVLGAQKSGDAGLVWYQNPTWERHTVARGEFTTDGKVADVDGDGDQDIVVGDLGSGLTWYENTGQGAEWMRHLVGVGYVHDIEIGDLDGDSRPEIVTCDKKELALWRLESSKWTRELLLETPGEGIALADVDGDSDLDVILGARWLENTGLIDKSWPVHVMSSEWPGDTRARAADINGDGRVDVVLTASEGFGRVSWFEGGPDGGWREHPISTSELDGAHSLAVTDLDDDGDLDVLVAEMHTSKSKRILNFVNDGDNHWRSQVLATTGSHNMQVADLDGDGDADLVGKNYAGAGRTVELWENLSRDNFGDNRSSAAPFLASGWQYVAIDENRDDDQRGKMGLLHADLNGDGRPDLIAGSFLYLNPGPDLSHEWTRVRLGDDIDVLFATDVDGDSFPDLIAIGKKGLLWIEAANRGAHSWNERVVGEVPDGRTQGYTTAQIETGGREELVFTRGNILSYVRIPERPEDSFWPRIVISTSAEEEGVAVGDIDRDGDLDILATAKGGHDLVWFENPGGSAVKWEQHRIGSGAEDRWLDRVAIADVNQDGRLDAIVTEETQDWTYNASLYWFEAPKDPYAADWQRRRISVLRSANSLDVSDLNHDGFPDVSTAEHTDMRESTGAPNNLTVVFMNVRGGASWHATPIESGSHSSHLGARLFDMDADGHPEIVSLGWNQFTHLHLWWRPSR